MTRRIAALLVLALGLAAGPSCGRKGPLQLPPGRAPQTVAGLSAAVEKEAIVLTWTNPSKTVAGTPLGPLREVEVWIFERDAPSPGTALTAEAVEKAARPILRVFVDGRGETMTRRVPLAEVGEKRPAFTARVLDRKGRRSEFSPLVFVDVDRPPAAALPEREGP